MSSPSFPSPPSSRSPRPSRPSASSTTQYSRQQRAVRRSEMAQLVAQGHSLAQVALAYDVAVTTVLAACREHGVAIPKSPATSGSKFKILAALLAGEEPLVVIADRLGVSRQRVYQVRDEAVASQIVLPPHVLATANPRDPE